MGALDFAGGTVVHVNAGVAALVAAIVVGKRSDYRRRRSAAQRAVHAARRRPAVVRLVRLQRRQRARGEPASPASRSSPRCWRRPRRWWSGRSSTRARRQADRGRRRHRHRRRPRRGHAGGRLHRPDERDRARRDRRGAELLRAEWRAKTSLDDSLDVVAAHGVGGTVGALLTGVFAQKALNGLADGALFGNPGQLGVQATAVAAAIVYSGVMSFILLKVIRVRRWCRCAPRSRRVDRPRHQRPRRRGVHCTPMGGGRSLAMMKETAPPRHVEALAPATK